MTYPQNSEVLTVNGYDEVDYYRKKFHQLVWIENFTLFKTLIHAELMPWIRQIYLYAFICATFPQW